jgi:hypothetical protein
MRRRILLVVAMTGLALGGGVATADTADARRNVGGTIPADSYCLRPGAVVLTGQAFDTVPCVCYVTLAEERVHNLGRGSCPLGLPEIKIERRNVGG